eukprot:gene12435-13599_t
MSEITSHLAFLQGGIFGFVRASAGPFIAYITAWYEIAFILTYIIIKVDQVMKILIALKVMSADFTPIAILIFYATSFLWNLVGGKIFWRFVTFLGFGVLLLYLIYLGGAADLSVRNHSLDYDSFCRTTIPLSMDNIMSSRNNLYGLYQGLQFIPLLSDSLRKPREQVPRVLIICSLTFVVLSVFLSLSSCSQYPGIAKLTKAKYPLVYGFSNVFNVSLQDSIWFNLPDISQNNNKKNESLRPVECVPGFSEDALRSSPTPSNLAPRSPMTESVASNEKITQLQVLPSSSESHKIQGPSQKSMSTKLSSFLSAKLNSVLPSEIAEKINYENDENQILVLSAGGILNDSVIESLKAKYGIDIESSENILS